jgi:hypothetical protein
MNPLFILHSDNCEIACSNSDARRTHGGALAKKFIFELCVLLLRDNLFMVVFTGSYYCSVRQLNNIRKPKKCHHFFCGISAYLFLLPWGKLDSYLIGLAVSLLKLEIKETGYLLPSC